MKLKESSYFHKGHLSLMGKRAVAGYLFVLPFIIGLAAIFIPSMVTAAVYSLNTLKYSPTGYSTEWNNFANYIKITSDQWYINELKNTGIELAYSVPLVTLFSFFMAIVLNQEFKGRTVARAILFLPVIISAGCILKVENSTALAGLVEAGDTVDAIKSLDITNFLISIGIPPNVCEPLSKIMGSIYEIISESGVQILVFLAALQTISPSLYEASTMEGATGWENFWKITFPMLSPYILVSCVYTIIDAASSFSSPFMKILNGLSDPSGAMEVGMAFSFIFFGLIAIVLGLFVLLVSRLVFYYD